MRHDTLLFAAIATSLPSPPLHLPAPLRPEGLTHSIIRSHCSAPPLLCPTAPPHTNGTNLYSLSALMSSHAERWPYHRASGSNHLSPSPAACQTHRVDGQAKRVQRVGEDVHICLHFHLNSCNTRQMCSATESLEQHKQ